MKPALLFASSLLLVAFAACGGKVVVDSPSGAGTGGTGGSGGGSTFPTTGDGVPNTTNSVTVGVTTVSVSASVTTGTGTSNCNPALTCADVISGNGDAKDLCPGSMADAIFSKFEACACATNCKTECAANLCIDQPLTPPCKMCLGSPDGCDMILQFCANN